MTSVLSSPVHDERVVARVGRWLGIAFTLCFLTGIVSHYQQHPVAWLPLGPEPVWGYRLTQGVHVAAGLACVPLLLAKLFAAYPRLFEWPPVRGVLHALERGSVAVLVAAALFQVSTGVMNIFQWYPWGFGFVAVHWATAWVAIGALAVHVAVKLPVIRRALSPVPAPVSGTAGETGLPEDEQAARTRRGFLVGTGLTVAAVTLTTAGQSVGALRPLALLAPRDPGTGPQGFPVNRSAAQAGVSDLAQDPGWALELVGPAGTLRLDRAALLAMPQRRATLPIACVEGWSTSVRWSGVTLGDLVGLAGGRPAAGLAITSMEPAGAYRATTLPPAWAAHPDSLLALKVDDEDLHLEHGFPARIIAPNRPGVLQTKWVERIEVLDV